MAELLHKITGDDALKGFADQALEVFAKQADLDEKADKTELEKKADASAIKDLATKTELEAKADKTALDAYLKTEDAGKTYATKTEMDLKA